MTSITINIPAWIIWILIVLTAVDIVLKIWSIRLRHRLDEAQDKANRLWTKYGEERLAARGDG